jgi:predicted glycoside hydrolase/deacetylase ChbG (UPF0249 family)
MSIRLIVNSDDYGRTAAVSQGARNAHLFGIVTSTSCMMNMPTVVDDIRTALQETPRLGLGVHLVLTSGQPLLPAGQVPSLVAPAGSFLKLDQFLSRLDQVDPVQVKAEWKAQIERFVVTAGRAPTHLDSHHHSSYFTEPFFRAMLELAREYGAAIRLVIAQGHADSMAGLPAEILTPIQEYAPRLLNEFNPKTPDIFHASFYDDKATEAELLRLITGLQPGTAELMCHPGYADAILLAGSSYARQRESELAILTDPVIRQAIRARRIELISFAQL